MDKLVIMKKTMVYLISIILWEDLRAVLFIMPKEKEYFEYPNESITLLFEYFVLIYLYFYEIELLRHI